MSNTKRLALLVLVVAAPVLAETNEIRCAQQYGTSYLALMIMQDQKLIEKHAKQAGLGDVKVTWAKLGGPGAMNDALLSGGLDFGTGGVPSLITLWAKTAGSPMEVRGVGALNDMPNELITSNPKVKSIKDFGPGDKIAVTTVNGTGPPIPSNHSPLFAPVPKPTIETGITSMTLAVLSAFDQKARRK